MEQEVHTTSMQQSAVHKEKAKTKHWLYIDANIYLTFYKGYANAVRKLLPSLQEIKANIFVTRQFRDEVNRNKVSVTQQTLFPVIDKVKWREWNLPELLNLKYGSGGPSWSEQAKAEEEKVLDSIDSVLREVAASKDPVSVGLSPIFSHARLENAEELVQARLRKELGNPPGKKQDPLGDQLSWIQFLSVLQNTDEVWIVTSDGDYHTSNSNNLYLNAHLMSDLMERGLDPVRIHVFSNVTQALTLFNKAAAPVKALPPQKILDEAEKEERQPEPARVDVIGGGPLGSRFRSFAFVDPKTPFSLSDLWSAESPFVSMPEYAVQLVPAKDIRSGGVNPYWPEKPPKEPVKLRAHWTRAKKKKRK